MSDCNCGARAGHVPGGILCRGAAVLPQHVVYVNAPDLGDVARKALTEIVARRPINPTMQLPRASTVPEKWTPATIQKALESLPGSIVTPDAGSQLYAAPGRYWNIGRAGYTTQYAAVLKDGELKLLRHNPRGRLRVQHVGGGWEHFDLEGFL